MNLSRWFNTVKYLRPEQIAAQIAHRARKTWENPKKILSLAAPPYPGCQWRPKEDFLAPKPPPRNFQINWPADWNRTDLPKLWQYNLHYFDFLWPLNYDEAIALAMDWIDHHPPGGIGWDAYPTSLRLMNWCCVFFAKFRERIEQDQSGREKIWASIYRQTHWLRSHLETHLLGNHLLENLAALAVVGKCFGGEFDSEFLQAQLAEQILPDGGHFERSPMYHSRVTYLLRLLDNIGIDVPLARACDALKKMSHPDGRIALLNDSAFDIYNEPAELTDGRFEIGNFSLPQTGYFGARTSDGSYLICDAGPIGPDYQPGHAHGDIFSFELSLRGHRVIVDSGVFDYQIGPMRDYCRSTQAHNTVEIAGQDQCEFWGAFRVARRARVHDVNWLPTDSGFTLSAWHDGYQRLSGRPTHRRTFIWQNSGNLTIKDELTAIGEKRFVSRIKLHPECRIVGRSQKSVQINFAAGNFSVEFRGSGNITVEETFYCPEFGMKLNTSAIGWSGNISRRSDVTLSITASEPGNLAAADAGV